MFEQENALPGSQLHFPLDNWHCFAGPREYRADMRWHVIGPFGAMCEIIAVFRDEPIEEFFQVTSRRRVGIFHDDYAATGMLHEDGHGPVS